MKPSLAPILIGTISAMLATKAAAIDVVKAANTSALNTAASWSLGAVPTSDDVAVWTNLVTGPNSSAIGGDLSWQGIRIADVGGTRNATNNVVIASAGSANTLTIGAGGIDMASAFQTLVIQARVTLGASQTWNISNANTATNPATLSQNEDLALIANTTTPNTAPVNLGGFTVTKIGAGTAAFSSGWVISNGVFDVNQGVLHFQGGGSKTTTINNDVTFNVNNNGTLRFAAQSGAGGVTTQVNAPINLNGGSTLALFPNQSSALNITGNITANGSTTLNVLAAGAAAVTPVTFSGNLLGSGNINYQNTNAATTPNFLRMAGDNSGYSGTFTLGGASGSRTLRLQNAAAGSAAATWVVNAANILQVDGVSVDLGSLNGAGTVTNSHAANPAAISVGAGTFSGTITNGAPEMALTKVGGGTLTLTGANSYTGATLVNGGALITSPAQSGTPTVTVADGATFGVKLSTPGTAFFTTDLTAGTATGATLSFDTGVLGNPIAEVMNATNFIAAPSTTLKLLGTNLGLTGGTPFPLLKYSTLNAGGFGNLSLSLPFRVLGGLVDNSANSSVDVHITAIGTPRWNGTLDNKWDIDSAGDGSTGTANWVATSGPNTYVQNAVNTDAVIFDDNASGAGPVSVDLTTTLSPANVRVENATRSYTFTGAGKISGPAALVKEGAGTLTIANALTNNHTGGTAINAGVLQIGDGATSGVGDIFGAITVGTGGTLDLNRPDDFSFSGPVAGTGTLTKNQTNVASIASATVFGGAINLAAGKLTLSSGGTLSGATSGVGELQAAGGTLELNGPDANAHTGMTTVSAGLLRLNKTAAVNAVSGDITITGTGQLALPSPEQIPDTATIFFTGSSTDSITTQVAMETVGNVVVNSSVGGPGGGQIIMRQGFTILGTGTVNSGILGVASSNTATVNEIIITAAPGSNGIVRIAGNGGPSTLNVRAGGITASGGEIQVKFNVNNQDAVLNLGGDFTATGDVAITNAGYTGPNLNVINLTDGDRTFDILTGTTTTVAPAVDGAAGSFDLIKTGDGTLTLNGVQNYPTLSTLVGTTNLNNILGTGTSSITSNGTTNITVSQTLASIDIGAGGVVVLGAPGAAPAPEFAGNDAGGFHEGTVQAVPEPGSLSLLALGALGMLGRRSRKN